MKNPLILLIIFSSLQPVLNTAIHAAPTPQTIPAVQEWTTGTGTYSLTTNTRIVINTDDASALAKDGRTFSEDLSGLLGRPISVVNGASSNDGDIFIALDATDTHIGDEGYCMTIGTSIKISAKEPAGAFYGTRTVLQLAKQGTRIDQGTIRDWPKGRWRGTMQDVGRKFYPMDWLERAIKDLAYVKMNMFHLHFCDAISQTNTGYFRIKSDSLPEISSTAIDADEYYTKEDIESLIALADKYHVTIVPELDFPGHCSWLYDTQYRNVLLGSKVLGNQYWALDLSKDAAYTLVEDILNEFMPLFTGPYWHIGADEYMFLNEYSLFPQLTTWAQNKYGSNAHANDCYRHFVNWADTLIQSKDKITLSWNDILLGFAESGHGVAPVNTSIHLQHWGDLGWIGWGGVYPDLLKRRGHYIINSIWDAFYIIGGDGSTGNPNWVYNSFELHKLAGGDLTAGDPLILGGVFPVWGDKPTQETTEQVWTNTFLLCRGIAQKSWASPTVTADYGAFRNLANALGRAPDPMVGNIIASPKLNTHSYGRVERILLYNIRGTLLKTISGDIVLKGRLNASVTQFLGNDHAPATGYYLCKLRGKGFEQSIPIMIMR